MRPARYVFCYALHAVRVVPRRCTAIADRRKPGSPSWMSGPLVGGPDEIRSGDHKTSGKEERPHLGMRARLSRTHASRAVPLNRYSSKLMTTSSVIIEEN